MAQTDYIRPVNPSDILTIKALQFGGTNHYVSHYAPGQLTDLYATPTVTGEDSHLAYWTTDMTWSPKTLNDWLSDIIGVDLANITATYQDIEDIMRDKDTATGLFKLVGEKAKQGTYPVTGSITGSVTYDLTEATFGAHTHTATLSMSPLHLTTNVGVTNHTYTKPTGSTTVTFTANGSGSTQPGYYGILERITDVSVPTPTLSGLDSGYVTLPNTGYSATYTDTTSKAVTSDSGTASLTATYSGALSTASDTVTYGSSESTKTITLSGATVTVDFANAGIAESSKTVTIDHTDGSVEVPANSFATSVSYATDTIAVGAQTIAAQNVSITSVSPEIWTLSLPQHSTQNKSVTLPSLNVTLNATAVACTVTWPTDTADVPTVTGLTGTATYDVSGGTAKLPEISVTGHTHTLPTVNVTDSGHTHGLSLPNISVTVPTGTLAVTWGTEPSVTQAPITQPEFGIKTAPTLTVTVGTTTDTLSHSITQPTVAFDGTNSVTVQSASIEATNAPTYTFSGTFTDGQVVINDSTVTT